MKTPKTVHLINDDQKYVLTNVGNYKPNIVNSTQDILNKFVSIITEYIKFISEKIVIKNKLYYKFILERGLETIIHIFSLIFYYTKNLELTFYHSQRAYYFYIEFIEQISDDNVTFLQLSSKDAILFVYKKTIYEINGDYIKNIQEPTLDEKNILSVVESYINIYKSITHFLLNHNDFKYENKKEYMYLCCKYIKFINEIINKNKIKNNNNECIYLFVNTITSREIALDYFFILLGDFIKNLNSKKRRDEKTIINNIYNSDIKTLIHDNQLVNINKILLGD